MKIAVDLTVCSGHANCEDRCPEVFTTDDEWGKCVIKMETVPEALREKTLGAIRNCPEGAIRVVEE